MKPLSHSATAVLCAASALLVLGACNPADRQQDRIDPARATDTVSSQVSSIAATAGNLVEDATLTAKVKAAFLADEMVKGTQINVDSNDGTVTLKGAVSTPTHKLHAEQVALDVEGVRAVQNNLTTQ